ncbi:MAG TPA: cellulase family glycosylhydrolase [Patescibacteria group bacterium]
MTKTNYLPGWGINLTSKDVTPKNYSWLVECIIRLKFEWIRYEFDFSSPVTRPEEHKFLKLCSKKRIKILGLLGYSVPGSLVNVFYPELNHQPVTKKVESFSLFVIDQVNKYKDLIDHWEILNETNTKRFWVKRPDHKEYVNILKKVVPKIRKIQPHASIIFGGIMGNDDTPSVPFQEKQYLKKCIERGANSYFTVCNFHPYTLDSYLSIKNIKQHTRSLHRVMEHAVNYAKNLCNKDIWFTEFGVSQSFWIRLRDHQVADLYLESYQWCQKRKIPLFLWSLCDAKGKQVSWLSPESHFGLLNIHDRPKPAFNYLVDKIEQMCQAY